MLNALKTNVWQFSAAKTHTQLRNMGNALLDANGNVRSFNDFKTEAQNISGTHLNWLRTEYDTAIGGAQMAGKWVEIQRQKELFPLLEFDAVMDKHTSDICGNLNGVIRPVDDPFWDKWMPLNHFRCRSTVRQLRNGTITPLDKIIYPTKVPKMFQVNLGKRGLVFPTDSAYYTDIPAHVFNNATLYMPLNEQYIVRYKTANGTELRVHRKTDFEAKADLPDIIKISKHDVDNGITVDILPEIHFTEIELRAKILKDANENMNPDRRLEIDGKTQYNEVEKPTIPIHWDKLQQRIASGAKQAESVTILLEAAVSKPDLKRLADERFRTINGLKKLTFVDMSTGEVIEYINTKGDKI